MFTSLKRYRLKRLAAALPTNPATGFDASRVLDGDLTQASVSLAEEAASHGVSGQAWWKLWRELQQELGRPLTESIAGLAPEQLRWFAGWSLKSGAVEEGIAAYRTVLAHPGSWFPLESENLSFIDALLASGRLAEAVTAVDQLSGDGADAEGEQCRVCMALIEAGKADEALERISPVRERYHDAGRTWAVTALAHQALGQEADAMRAAVEAAKSGLFDQELLEQLQARVMLASQWEELQARFEYQPSGIAAQQEAWGANPGADLVPGPPDSPHLFGSDLWRMPACLGCGHTVRAWFTLDLAAVPSLQAALPGWRYFPLLGCVDCMVWMGRHDYTVDPIGRAVELVNVAISTRQYGQAHDTTPPIPAQPAALAWRRPLSSDGVLDDPPQAPQVGGAPSWTQDATRVYCPACRMEMVFVASMANPQGFVPAVPINNESGFQYHFACSECRRLSVIAQWT